MQTVGVDLEPFGRGRAVDPFSTHGYGDTASGWSGSLVANG